MEDRDSSATLLGGPGHDGPIMLVPGKPDSVKADEYKARLRPLLDQVCTIMDEAAREGFILQMSLGMVPPGKNVIQQLLLVKQF